MGEPGGTTVDSAMAGRMFPFSRAFARMGFNRIDAERWRRDGWHDPIEAAPWYPGAGDCTPRQLRALADAGVEPQQVAKVALFAERHTAAWTRALVSAPSEPEIELDLRDFDLDADVDAQTRMAVRANLLRDSSPQYVD